MQIKVDFLCRDSILAAPIVLDLALFMDLAARAGESGVQEWLSFYLKAPQAATDVPAEHDLFIQQTKRKNTLREWMGEEPVTHSEAGCPQPSRLTSAWRTIRRSPWRAIRRGRRTSRSDP
jgi:myo-inositol-1-phosphate synthase